MRKFFVPADGKPRGQGRPRFNPYTRAAYKESKDIANERNIAALYRAAYPRCEPFKEPFIVVLGEVFSDNSLTKAQKEAAKQGRLYPTVKPDIDNIAKAVLDALNGVAFADDKFCVGLHVTKSYGDRAGVYVAIWEVNEQGG